MGKEEQSKRNSPEFKRLRWSGGERAEERSDLPAMIAERRGGGGIVDVDAGRRRVSAPEWSRSTAARALCSSVRR
jgi:hypothetical protein